MIKPLKQRKGLSLAVVAIFFAGLLVWLGEERTIELFTAEEPDSDAEPDAFILNATYLTFGENGELQSRLTTRKAEHIPNGDYGLLTEPEFALFGEAPNTWEMRAQEGRLNIQGDQLELDGFVTVTGRDQKGKALRFDAPSLSFNEETGEIHTDQSVTINSQFNQLSAKGMTFNIDSRILTLHSQVKGIYVQD